MHSAGALGTPSSARSLPLKWWENAEFHQGIEGFSLWKQNSVLALSLFAVFSHKFLKRHQFSHYSGLAEVIAAPELGWIPGLALLVPLEVEFPLKHSLGSFSSPLSPTNVEQSNQGVQGERLEKPHFHPGSSQQFNYGIFPFHTRRSNPGHWLSYSRSIWDRRLEQGLRGSTRARISHQDLWIAQEGGDLANIWNLGSRLAAKHGASACAGLCVPGNSVYSCFSRCYFNTLLWARVDKQEE